MTFIPFAFLLVLLRSHAWYTGKFTIAVPSDITDVTTYNTFPGITTFHRCWFLGCIPVTLPVLCGGTLLCLA